MIRKNKLKILSILSAICLWIYVMVIINPDSTLTLESVPVNISNTLDLAENNLVLSRDSKVTVNVFLEGKISDLRKLKKENVRVSMEIENPSEGKNEAKLSVSTPSNISYKLKEDNIVVNLEKIVYKNYDISIVLPEGVNKKEYIVNSNTDTVKISGSRNILNRIDKVVAVVTSDMLSSPNDFGVQLKALDYNGLEVENVLLENSIVDISVKKIKQKDVPLDLVFEDEIDIKNIEKPFEKLTISGEEELVNSISNILTEPINTKKLKDKGSIKIKVVIPEGVSLINNKEMNNKFDFSDNSFLISLKKQ